MKKVFIIIGSIIGVILAIALVFGFAFWYMFGGGVYFLPNPPKPEIKYGEFTFKLEYEISGNKRTLSDTIICQFDGYNTDEGRGKTRRWKYHYKNEENNDILELDIKFPKIILYNIEHYKIFLGTANAEYFLGEPNYKGIPELPSIQVYDTNTGYYKDPTQSNEFLDTHNFKVISWKCDSPIQNSFK